MAEDKSPNSPASPFAIAADQIRSKADDFYTFYSNNVSVGFSTWEMSVTFGEITGSRDGRPVVEEVAKVLMTREFAKVLARLLTANIAAYESAFGEIKSPHFGFLEQPVVADFESLSPSASPSISPSASTSPSSSASPSPENEDES